MIFGQMQLKKANVSLSFVQVKEITRTFKLVNGELTYIVEMATGVVSRQPHLKASLTKL